MTFLPIAISAYVFNAGAIIIDRILLRTALPNPITYTFFVNVLQLLVIFLIPFGFSLNVNTTFFLALFSGVVNVFALYAYFKSLRVNEASVVGPIVGTFNPFFALLLGIIFLSQALTFNQYFAFFVLLIGTLTLTWSFWQKGIRLNQRFLWMFLAGFFFGLSYVLLREAFLHSPFLQGFITSRLSAGTFALLFLLFPKMRQEIFTPGPHRQALSSHGALLLLGAGQIMGAASVTLLTIGVYLASPALVNSFFGVQYLIILSASLILAKKHPHLLEEHLSKGSITQKIFGAAIISLGLYLLAKQ